MRGTIIVALITVATYEAPPLDLSKPWRRRRRRLRLRRDRYTLATARRVEGAFAEATLYLGARFA